jgi:hypothetical protein
MVLIFFFEEVGKPLLPSLALEKLCFQENDQGRMFKGKECLLACMDEMLLHAAVIF